MNGLYWPHHVGMGPCVLKRAVGTEARPKAGTLTIFYCVTSTEKKLCAMNWEQHIYAHHERFSPIKTLQLQTNHTFFSNKVKQLVNVVFYAYLQAKI